MPFYRIGGLSVHLNMRGKKAPSPCVVPIELDGKKVRCMGLSVYLCDHEGSDGKTCDAPLCQVHATEIGRNKHLCPRHAAERAEKEPELF
jgi:hypothetical protein